MAKKQIIGSEEWIDFTKLKLHAVKARVDSGAKTSSLHAFNIEVKGEGEKQTVHFDIHPVQNNRRIVKRCKANLIGKRIVRSSSGERENRFVIKTFVKLGLDEFEIELTLSNRDEMGYRMLLGREAMKNRFLVDPDASFVKGNISDRKIKEIYKKETPKKSGLKIALLATNPDLYSNKRIIEAGEARGHEMLFVKIRQAYMNINAKSPKIYYEKGEDITDIDAVIPRIRPALTFYGCAVTRQFQASGAFCLNGSESITNSRDKLRSLQLLASKGIDMPVTGFARSPQNTKDLIKMVGGAPLVIKLLESSQGAGVILAETVKAAESVINGFKTLKANFLVQEFIKESAGRDIRCFVVDNKVVSAVERRSSDGDFRANIHLGGTAASVNLTKEEKKIALSATKIMGLKIAGVDLLRTKKGPKILEVNSSPGLEGIESATGKDIAGLMISAVEKHLGFKKKIKKIKADRV